MSSLDTDENGQQQQVSSFNYHLILVDYRFCCKEEFAAASTRGCGWCSDNYKHFHPDHCEDFHDHLSSFQHFQIWSLKPAWSYPRRPKIVRTVQNCCRGWCTNFDLLCKSASEIIIRLEAAAAAVKWSLRYIAGSRISNTWAPAAGGLRRGFAISETVANGIWVGAASHTTPY